MTIPPETLKSIAEAMGYEYEGTHENGNVWCSKKGIVSKYNPPNNPAQLLELIEWLLKKGWGFSYIDGIGFVFKLLWEPPVLNKSFPHAVMAAVIKELEL